jgi:hypothetical protein
MCPLNGPWFTYLKTMIFHSYVELQSKDLSLYIVDGWSFICLLDVISTAVRNKQSKENEGYRWVHCAPNICAGPKTFVAGVRRFQRQQKNSGFPESSLAECHN